MPRSARLFFIWFFFMMIGWCPKAVPEARGADIYADSFGYDRQIRLETRSGYRKGSMNWSIAAPDFSPNVLSELQYNDMAIYEAGIDARAVINKIYSKASVSFGRIIEGTGVDSDYQENNRSSMYSRSESNLSDEMHNLCIGLGYQMDFFRNRLLVAPLAGVAYRSQTIRQTDGVQTVSSSEDFSAAGREISGLNSTYEANWRSLFVGFDVDLELIQQIHLTSSFEYHTASYEAYADWNLRDDFAHPVSFTHEATGQGRNINVSLNRKFAERWLIGLMYGWQDWETDPGTDTLFWSGGGATRSPLNSVTWESQSINLSIGYNF